MAINKTLYVRDEDAPIWDRAKDMVGDSLSNYVTNHLRMIVAGKEASAKGFERIVLAYREKGKLPRAQAFYGKWLVSPSDPWERNEQNDDPDWYAVAITAKNQIAVFNFYRFKADSEGKFDWGELRIFESFSAATEGDLMPDGLIALAMERMGVEIEELDI